MKILLTTSFFPPYHIGGDAVHVKYLAESLKKQGHEVHVMFSMDAFNLKVPNKIITAEKTTIRLHPLRSPLGKLEPVLNYVLGTQNHTLSEFRKLVQKENFDIVHHHNISLLGYKILKKIRRYRNIYTAHDYWLICHKYDYFKDSKVCDKHNCLKCCLKNMKPYQPFRNSASFRDCINDIDTIIAPSTFMKKTLNLPKVKHIYNYVPEIMIDAEIKIKDKKVEKYFVYAGYLCEQKGLLDLLKVFSKIDKKLLIVGTGPLEKKIRSFKLANIEICGWKSHEELMNIIARAQAVIVPSKILENNPLIALESISLGTPVIGSNIGGIPEIVSLADKKLVYSNLQELENILIGFDKQKHQQIKKVFSENFSEKIFFEKYWRIAC